MPPVRFVVAALLLVFVLGSAAGAGAARARGGAGVVSAQGAVATLRAGASVAAAKRREHHYYVSENSPAMNERTAAVWLSLDQSIVTTAAGWRPGNTIAGLTLESRTHPIGLEFV